MPWPWGWCGTRTVQRSLGSGLDYFAGSHGTRGLVAVSLGLMRDREAVAPLEEHSCSSPPSGADAMRHTAIGLGIVGPQGNRANFDPDVG